MNSLNQNNMILNRSTLSPKWGFGMEIVRQHEIQLLSGAKSKARQVTETPIRMEENVCARDRDTRIRLFEVKKIE